MSGDKDSEITLGMGKLLGIFFGLVVFCGLSLGIGYRLGWNSAMQEATIHPNAASASSTSAPDSAKETAGAANNGTTAQSSDCSGADCAPAAAEEGGAASERYPVLVTQPGDKLFHVQVGPYADLKDAKDIRQRLLQAGYSAFLKK
jgi:DedD protein